MSADVGGLGWWAGPSDIAHPERGPPKDHSIKVWSQLAKQFQRRRFLNIFPLLGPMLKLCQLMSVVLFGGRGQQIKS